MQNGRERASIARDGIPLTTAIEAALDHARAVGDHTVAACLARALEAVAREPLAEPPGTPDPDTAEGPARRLQADIARKIARPRRRR